MANVQKVLVDAILFDMDGTLIDSTPGVYKAWATFSEEYSLGDSEKIVHATHGRRLYDTLKEYCKIIDEEELVKAIDRFEDAVILGGPVALPGALDLLNGLNALNAKWTIATSATNKYTPGALAVAGLPIPDAGIITSNDVVRGKPHPDPYLAAAVKCGVDAKDCLVVEDAISGINAGKAAGSKVLAVSTSTPREHLLEVGQPDYIVTDLRSLSLAVVDGKIEVTIITEA